MKDNFLWKRVHDLNPVVKKGQMVCMRPNALAGVWIALMEDGDILWQCYASSYRRARVILNNF